MDSLVSNKPLTHKWVIYKHLLIKVLNNIKQACEQFNAWLGGFESILKHMVPGNFDWFLHTMLFYHTRYVLKKQHKKRENEDNNDDDESDDDSDNEIDVLVD